MTNGVPCDSVRYMSHGIEYSNICGRAVGHTHSGDSTCGFWWSHQRRHSFDRYINGFYASGVTITRGPNNDRTHVWTYASGHKDKPSKWPFSIHCNRPCAGGARPPNFVGTNYFSESATKYNLPRPNGTQTTQCGKADVVMKVATVVLTTEDHGLM